MDLEKVVQIMSVELALTLTNGIWKVVEFWKLRGI